MMTIPGLAVLVPPLAAYAALSYLYPGIAQSAALYCAFAVAYILLPSYAFSRLLLPMRLGVAERICLGYPISQAALFLLAWGGSRLGTLWAGYAVLPLLSLYACWDIARAKAEDRQSPPFFLLLVCCATALALAFCFLYFVRNPFPTADSPAGYYYDDALMTLGTFSAAKAMVSGLPFVDGRFGDIPASYHIMLFVNNAMAHLVARVHPLVVQVFLYPVLHWALTVGAVVAGCRHLAGFSKTQTVLAVTLVFFTAGFSFNAIYFIQTFSNFHTFFYSFPASLVLGLLLYGVLSDKLPRLPVVFSTLLFFAAGAAKAVVALQVPLALFPVLVYRVWKRKAGRNDLIFIGAVLVSVLLLRVTEYQSAGQLIIKKFNVINSFSALSFNLFDSLPLLLLVYALASRNRLTAYKLSQQTQYGLFVVSMFVVGQVLTRAIEFVGGEQYFFWYFRMYLCIFAAAFLAYAFDKKMRGVVVLTAGVVLASAVYMVTKQDAFLSAAKSSVQARLDRGEWDGLMWAYNNLDRTKRIVCNKMSFMETRGRNQVPAHYYDYLSVSGMYGYAWVTEWLPDEHRKQLTNRLDLVNAFWSAATPAEQEQLLRRIPADYLFVNNRHEPHDYSMLPGVRRIYSNPSFDIYALPGGASSPSNPMKTSD